MHEATGDVEVGGVHPLRMEHSNKNMRIPLIKCLPSLFSTAQKGETWLFLRVVHKHRKTARCDGFQLMKYAREQQRRKKEGEKVQHNSTQIKRWDGERGRYFPRLSPQVKLNTKTWKRARTNTELQNRITGVLRRRPALESSQHTVWLPTPEERGCLPPLSPSTTPLRPLKHLLPPWCMKRDWVFEVANWNFESSDPHLLSFLLPSWDSPGGFNLESLKQGHDWQTFVLRGEVGEVVAPRRMATLCFAPLARSLKAGWVVLFAGWFLRAAPRMDDDGEMRWNIPISPRCIWKVSEFMNFMSESITFAAVIGLPLVLLGIPPAEVCR